MFGIEFLFFAVIFPSAWSTDPEHLGDLPMLNPDLFEGDILGIDHHSDRNAIVNPKQMWPNGVVPYEVDPGLRVEVTNFKLTNAMNFYHKDTCVKFVPRTNEKDYVRLFLGKGCYSHVGRTGGMQPLSLGPGCGWMGTIIHELGHAIGFYHEQNRSDRDDYINIIWENIQEGLTDQFFKLSPQQNRLITKFDYNSIMLYGEYTFSKDRKNLKTMVAKQPGIVLKEVIVKYKMSQSDIDRVNILYNCKKQ